MPVVSAKLSESNWLTLIGKLRGMGYNTFGEFIRAFLRDGVTTKNHHLEEKVDLLVRKVELLLSNFDAG